MIHHNSGIIFLIHALENNDLEHNRDVHRPHLIAIFAP